MPLSKLVSLSRMINIDESLIVHRAGAHLVVAGREKLDHVVPVFLIFSFVHVFQFEEDDGLVLVDYKTDRVKEGGENILLDRYQIQLFYYAKALAQITGKKVKEAVIYSLALQKEIPVPINL